MFRLHLRGALLAAVITLVISDGLHFLMFFIYWSMRIGDILDWRYIEPYLMEQPGVIRIILEILVKLSIPLAILWRAPRSRRLLSNPWMAAACGVCLCFLLLPLLLGFPDEGILRNMIKWYSETFVFLGPITFIPGGLYFFLHSFFIRQALGKKAWLETRA
ncbi:hypothetical protein OVA24_16920 [Luteolibacter sp. SL250]|uniref:hypothetical protein n=1 Tax=Luteolibacter sp. SL250 TaxID=2995170 RepID=UPI00226E009B|nr:hypothetical protein [Luteolibacter sp. SL250]WAC18916.1 hypothetical protein OVA24_16920 [Luteolibacter sp. SL250]